MDSPHEVFNQPQPRVGYKRSATHQALRDALSFNAPPLDTAMLATLDAALRSATLQAPARLANVNLPVLHSHDRCGRRIDQVECHPAHHARRMLAPVSGLHGTPWSDQQASAHDERAAGWMLFTHLVPAQGAHPAHDRLCTALPGHIDGLEGAANESDVRPLAQDVARVGPGAAWSQTAPTDVFDAFCESRIVGHWGHTVGTRAAETHFENIIARAVPR